MNNFKQPGHVLTFTAPAAGVDPEAEPGGVLSGNAYLIGNLLVVASNNAGAEQPFEGVTSGVFDLPKATGETWSEGQLLYWDDVAGELTTTDEDNTPVGCAASAAGSDAVTGSARLSGVPALPVSLGT